MIVTEYERITPSELRDMYIPLQPTKLAGFILLKIQLPQSEGSLTALDFRRILGKGWFFALLEGLEIRKVTKHPGKVGHFLITNF